MKHILKFFYTFAIFTIFISIFRIVGLLILSEIPHGLSLLLEIKVNMIVSFALSLLTSYSEIDRKYS